MKIEGKYLFGIVAVLGLIGLQISAWYMGFNGQITSLCTAGISSLISFLIGLEILPPSAKKTINEAVVSIINAKKP